MFMLPRFMSSTKPARTDPFARFKTAVKPPLAAREDDLVKARAAEAAAEAELAEAIRESHERARLFAHLKWITENPGSSPFAHLRGVDFTPMRHGAMPVPAARPAARERPALRVVPGDGENMTAEGILAAAARAAAPMAAPPLPDNPTARAIIEAVATHAAGGPALPEPPEGSQAAQILAAYRKHRGEE